MGEYELTWITDNLAVGHAPMSYADLDLLQQKGINAIVNLCGEFCDLHEIEAKSGFEVYYLPIPDECAPDMAEMEKALNWLDEAIYLNKTVLVHCRFGVGRTGTFVTSYLIRRGLGLKLASKRLKKTRATPTNWSQWRLLKKYHKKTGMLKIREPALENRQIVDLSNYFAEYESIVHQLDKEALQWDGAAEKNNQCGRDTDVCCHGYFELELIEAIYLSNHINRDLKRGVRSQVIHQAIEVTKKTTQLLKEMNKNNIPEYDQKAIIDERFNEKGICCPLNQDGQCLVFVQRPLRCRRYNLPPEILDTKLMAEAISTLSRNVFFAFSGQFMGDERLIFSLAETVSGRFVQRYFYYMASLDGG